MPQEHNVRLRGLYRYNCLYLFLMVGDNATDEVGVGVPQGSHQFSQLFFVKLPHCSEHTLPGFKGPRQCSI